MSAPKQLKLLRSIKTGKGLMKLILSLQLARKSNKIVQRKRGRLSSKQREAVLAKTNGHCHICGVQLSAADFQADHVLSHCMGGNHAENNYLPACTTCNNYRWHYSSVELQIVLKLGVWAKARIAREGELGTAIADEFVKHVVNLRKRKS